MRYLFSIALLFSLLTATSCDWANDDDFDCEPDVFCDTIAPDYGVITLKVTINAENPMVPVEVFYGDFDDDNFYQYVEMTEESITISAPVDERYSATAIYQDGARTIRAIDGDRINLKSEEDCFQTCYTVKDATLNLKLQ